MGLTTTQIKAAFDAKYIDAGQGRKDLMKEFFVPSVTEQEFNVKPSKDTVGRKARLQISKVVQQYQKALTPNADIVASGYEIPLQKMKYEASWYPDEIEESYLGFMASNASNNPKEWPISRYIAEVLLIQKGREEIELNEIYSGVTAAITPGTATLPGKSMNGLGKVIADSVTAGVSGVDVNVVNFAATISTDPVTFLEQIEAWIAASRASSPALKFLIDNHFDKIHLNESQLLLAAQGVNKKYDINYMATGNNVMKVPTEIMLPFSKLKLKSLPSMSASERMFMTYKENRGCLKKTPAKEMNIDTQVVGREVFAFTDFFEGIGFWDKNHVVVTQHS